MMSGRMLSDSFKAWLEKLISRWPQVESVALADGLTLDPDERAVVVFLEPACYLELRPSAMEKDEEGKPTGVCKAVECRQRSRFQEYGFVEPLLAEAFYFQVDKIEQRIACDPELAGEHADDLLFCNPGCILHQWRWFDIEDLWRVLDFGEMAVVNAKIDAAGLLEAPEAVALEAIEVACASARGEGQPLFHLEALATGHPFHGFKPEPDNLMMMEIVYQRPVT